MEIFKIQFFTEPLILTKYLSFEHHQYFCNRLQVSYTVHSDLGRTEYRETWLSFDKHSIKIYKKTITETIHNMENFMKKHFKDNTNKR